MPLAAIERRGGKRLKTPFLALFAGNQTNVSVWQLEYSDLVFFNQFFEVWQCELLNLWFHIIFGNH
jgi:hypothetical protein